MRNENHFIFDRFLLLLLHYQQHTTSKLVMSLFHWPDCSLGVSQPGGRGGKYGCIGLAEWGEGVVWRGPNGATEMFKVSGSRWERCADGEGVGGACLLVHRGNMLAVGGQGGGGGGYSTKVRKLKIEMKKIRLCKSEIPDMLIGCGQSCCISDGDYLVVMGGCGASGVLDVVQVYSHETEVWSLGRALPTPCAGGSAMLHQCSVILLGGNHMGTSVWHAKISDLLTGGQEGGSIWKPLPDVPYCWSSVCMVGGVLLAIGGQDQSLASKKTSAIYAFSERFRTWLHVGDLPSQYSLVDSLVCGGDLVVVDGASGRAVLGKLNEPVHERLKSLEQVKLGELIKEVDTLKQTCCKLEAALKKKEEEMQEASKRESVLVAALKKKEEEMLEASRNRERVLEAALKKKEEEMQEASRNRKHELEAALKKKEEEMQEASKRESVLETALKKEEEMLEASRNRERELEAALKKKEEEMQEASRKRKCELEAALSDKESKLNDLNATLTTDRHHIEVIEGERLKLKAIVEHYEKAKMVEAQQEQPPKTICIHQEPQEKISQPRHIFGQDII
eukprot:Em0002g1142a